MDFSLLEVRDCNNPFVQRKLTGAFLYVHKEVSLVDIRVYAVYTIWILHEVHIAAFTLNRGTLHAAICKEKHEIQLRIEIELL